MSLNIMEAFEAKPQPIDYVLPNLAIGTIGAIVSPGGAEKVNAGITIGCADYLWCRS